MRTLLKKGFSVDDVFGFANNTLKSKKEFNQEMDMIDEENSVEILCKNNFIDVVGLREKFNLAEKRGLNE